MTIERRNPLPVGRYWIDIFESNSAAWQGWIASNRSTVRVETTEDHPSAGDAPARQFFIFAVSAPTPWPDNRGLGLPSIAGADVDSSDDTATRPPPPQDVVDQITDAARDAAGKVSTALAIAVAAVVTIAGVTFVVRRKKK